MPSSKEFRDFILGQLSHLPIEAKPMMGEFLLYYSGVLIGGIYDNRLLIKKTKSSYAFSLPEAIPYKNAKPMYQIENLDDVANLEKLISITYSDIIKKT